MPLVVLESGVMESSKALLLGEAARRKQGEASSPKNHVWTTAHAGSGKTTVLVNRVLRLLLAGEEAHRILCITYTRTGSVEMMDRVRKVLGRWSVMGDESLREELLKFQEEVGEEAIESARGLFLKVLDMPGGLQVHTFHGFCRSVLGRFPLEADVTPGFTLTVEERVPMLEVLSEILAGRGWEVSGEAISFLSKRMGEKEFFELLEKIYRERRKVERVLGTDSRVYGVKLSGYLERMWKELDVPKERVEMERKRDELLVDEGLEEGLRGIVKAVRGGDYKKTGKKIEEGIGLWLSGDVEARREGWKAFVGIFFKRDSFEWKKREEKVVAGCGGIFVVEELLRDRVLRLEAGYEWGCATASFLEIAVVILSYYEKHKQRKGLLDYDDLIVRVQALLGEAGGDQAGWVHFKLDGGIRHVLVDEAQDTHGLQWSILESLVHEFYAGYGVEVGEERGERTLFVVGDPKQAIFGFQGSGPEAMQASKVRLDDVAKGADKEIKEVGLGISFRSGREILSYVDRVFLDERLSGLGLGEGEVLRHESYRYAAEGAKGFVMVLPLCKGVQGEEGRERRGDEILAHLLVEGLARMCGRFVVPSTGKPLRAGDVMFLFRKRRKMQAVMRVLQRKGFSVTTRSDEYLSENVAVVDVMNVLEVVLSPEDDYRLACVMKSPFVGWCEEDLLSVAYGRGGRSLWSCVEERGRKGLKKEERLWRWILWLRKDREGEGVYALVHRLMYGLCPFGGGEGGCTGYQAMVGRLGVEAGEALEMLLGSVRKREVEGSISLRDMVDELLRDERSVKSGGEEEDAVRLMTIHGAKGLEAPLVVLADTLTMGKHGGVGERFRLWDGEVEGEEKLWYGRGKVREGMGLSSLQSLIRHDEEREWAEEQRLLYVALTRARDGLIVGGAYEKRKPVEERSWYTYLKEGIEKMEGVRKESLRGGIWDGEGEGWEEEEYWVLGEWERVVDVKEGEVMKEEEREEEEEGVWYRHKAKSELGDVWEMRRASGFVESVKRGDGLSLLERDKRSLHRGVLVHRLFEVLSDLEPEERERRGKVLLAREGTFFSEEEREEMWEEVLGVWRDERLGMLFEGGYAEVPIGGVVEVEGREVRVQGRIDRLVVREEEVLLVDYKTGKRAKVLPEEYRMQMRVYGELVRRLWKDRIVRGFVVWTSDVSWDELEDEEMRL